MFNSNTEEYMVMKPACRRKFPSLRNRVNSLLPMTLSLEETCAQLRDDSWFSMMMMMMTTISLVSKNSNYWVLVLSLFSVLSEMLTGTITL